MHKCAFKLMQVAVVEEELEEEGEFVEQYEFGQEDETRNQNYGTLELPLFSINGMTQPQTLKIRGRIKNEEVVVMIDSGASHNFVARKMVERMGMKIDETVKFGVCLGDGTKIRCQGVCHGIEIQLGTYKTTILGHLFELGGVDVIMGVDWLRTLGEVLLDWSRLKMCFTEKGQRVELNGDATLQRSMLSLRSIYKLTDVDYSAALFPVEKSRQRSETEVIKKQPEVLQKVMDKFKVVLDKPVGLPPNRDQDHAIIIKEGQGPVQVRPYRYAHHQKNEIEKMVTEMLDAWIIQPSTSPYSSPVILVKKKDGSWRFCVDYRALKEVTISDKYPIPVVEELLDELHGSVWFSKLDLRAGYHQIRVRQGDVEKTAFRTHLGHYEFLVMPFGLKNAPSTFQATMNNLLCPHLRKFVLVFFDDILIFSRNIEEHANHLQIVLQILQDNQLYVNAKKCEFGLQEIEYLGHVVSGEGVAVDTKKVESVQAWPRPRNIKGLRGFLGLSGYYRKFIRDYGKVAKPLTDLLKKGAFEWNTEAKTAFEELKQKLTTAPVLKLPDFEEEFVVECDASGRGIGAVLAQKGRPIAFFSKALAERALAKSTYEKELMALVLAVRHWRPYLLGRSFVVLTDHKALKDLLHQQITTQDQQQWLAKLLGYEFQIRYKAGNLNGAADALSRCVETEGNSISIPQWQDMQEITAAVQQDSKLRDIMDKVEKGGMTNAAYTISRGLLWHKNRMVLPRASKCVNRIIDEGHNSAEGGHAGAYRTLRRISNNFYWAGMKKDVYKHVAECLICQRQKYQTLKPAGLLQPLPIPEQVWEDISMDFITGLPKSKGFEVLFVVIDRLSKYGHFILLKHPYTAQGVAEKFVKEVVRLHGIPRSIVSDRDSVFMSHFWREVFRLQGTKLTMSSAYHAETDGQTEVLNRCIETYLRCFVSEQPRNWSAWVHWAEYWYNTAYQTAAGMSPFEVVYGRKPPGIKRFLPAEANVAAVARELLDRDEVLKQLKYNLERAQQRMIRDANVHRRDVMYELGDTVFLKLRPHRQQSVCSRIFQKLAPKYFGPFVVTQRIGKVAYKLQLPVGSRIHPVFHVSQLKKAVGKHANVQELPAGLEQDLSFNYEPLRVVGHRQKKQVGILVPQVLVQWKGKAPEEATWEDAADFQAQFPNTSLGDKAALEGEAIDSAIKSDGVNRPNPIVQVYRRRPKTQ
ncbi:hypothetical protein F511_10541 [Dorcoceras hygrometricum]|uniref:Peroxidase 64 n=1 Tax=Dorcoceras hygrometricum TaxID=472368 RepID=A0A2Z7CXX9_9LAMI|nr:hypothetical protein F511_10541 [Dorcoceras hygrometricum]